MNPGQGTLCRGCRHFSFESWNAGHPNPCCRNRWIGTKHHAPALTADGKSCDEFAKRAKERQRARKGKQPGASSDNCPHLSEEDEGKASDQAGKPFGVSGKSPGKPAKDIPG